MEIVILLAFVGLALVVGALLLFTKSLRARDWQHVDRLSLLVLHEDRSPEVPKGPQ